MKNFTLLREQNEVLNKLSNKYKKLKEIVLSNIEFTSVDDLKSLLQMNIDSLNSKGSITIPGLQTQKELMAFFDANSDLIDDVLADTDWFTKTPSQLDIHSVMVWITSAIEKALYQVIQTIINEL